jgi:hypothetical protein
MVSPLALEPLKGTDNGYQASVAGGGMAFYSKAGAPGGSPSFGPYYLSKRGPGGWVTEDAIPPQSTAGGDFCNPAITFSPDLSKGVLQDGWNWGEGHPKYPDDNGSNNCSHDEPALVPGEPRGAQNLFLRNNETGTYQLINTASPEIEPRDAWFQAGSNDFSRIVFTDPIPLTAGAPIPPAHADGVYAVGEDLYESTGTGVRLVTVLPGGEPVWGLLVNGDESHSQGSAVWTHAVSSDGERVFFYAGGETVEVHKGPGGWLYVGGGLYVRENAGREQSNIAAGRCTEPAKACTVQVDVAEPGASGSSGDGHFEWASSDGSTVYFTDESRLTADSKAEPEKPDLYRYEVNPETGGRGTLTDITAEGSEPADVQGLSGVSEDGTYAYIVADGNLTGEQKNGQGAEAQAGKPNLYLYHEGTTTFITTLLAVGEDSQNGSVEGDACDWDSFSSPGYNRPVANFEQENCMTARVSPDGQFLAFNSLKSLTGYNNVVAGTSERDHEIFLYDATNNTLSCASCNPNPAIPPTAEASSGQDPRIGVPTHGEQWYRTPGYLAHYLSDTGQVFFTTQNRLLPQAENGLENVYTYDSGTLSLISSGTSADNSVFRDATPSGSDIFFTTAQPLVGADTDNTLSLYDARVNGGFPEPPPPPPPCTESCQGALPAVLPGASSPLTASFTGPTSTTHLVSSGPPPPVRCKKGYKKTKVHGKTICKKLPGKHHKHKTTHHTKQKPHK